MISRSVLFLVILLFPKGNSQVALGCRFPLSWRSAALAELTVDCAVSTGALLSYTECECVCLSARNACAVCT